MTGARRPRFRALQKTHRIGRPQCLENPKPLRGRNADETERAPLQAEPERLHHRCIAVRNRRPPNRWQMPLRNSPALPTDSAIEPKKRSRLVATQMQSTRRKSRSRQIEQKGLSYEQRADRSQSVRGGGKGR